MAVPPLASTTRCTTVASAGPPVTHTLPCVAAARWRASSPNRSAGQRLSSRLAPGFRMVIGRGRPSSSRSPAARCSAVHASCTVRSVTGRCVAHATRSAYQSTALRGARSLGASSPCVSIHPRPSRAQPMRVRAPVASANRPLRGLLGSSSTVSKRMARKRPAPVKGPSQPFMVWVWNASMPGMPANTASRPGLPTHSMRALGAAARSARNAGVHMTASPTHEGSTTSSRSVSCSADLMRQPTVDPIRRDLATSAAWRAAARPRSQVPRSRRRPAWP